MTVQNIGAGSADSSKVEYYLSNRKIDDDDVRSMDAGGEESEYGYYTFTSSDVGAHTIKAVADSDSEISEANENNNETSTGSFTVSRAPRPSGQQRDRRRQFVAFQLHRRRQGRYQRDGRKQWRWECGWLDARFLPFRQADRRRRREQTRFRLGSQRVHNLHLHQRRRRQPRHQGRTRTRALPSPRPMKTTTRHPPLPSP